MAVSDYWLARCHVMATHPSARRWEEEADEAVTVAAILADNEDDVREQLQQQCRADGLGLLRIDAIETLLQRCRREGLVQGLVELAHTTSSTHPVAYGEMLPLLPEPAAEPEPATPTPAVAYQETTWQALLGPQQPPLWAVIDGVNCREAMARLQQPGVHSACLYASTDDATRANAPWLVRLEADSEVRNWLESLPQDQHWGVLLHSHATLKQLRSHLRKFTLLWTPANDQAPVYFRFYDPRVALDMSQALEPWKLAALMAPLEALIVPASPLMTLPPALTFIPEMTLDTEAREVHGRLVSIALSDDTRAANGQGRQFAIGQTEYRRFGEFAQSRASQALARSLKERYLHVSESERMRAVIDARALGQSYGLSSKKQITTLAVCVLDIGPDFVKGHPEAERILGNPQLAAWRKCQLLETWLPRGRLRQALLAPYQHAGQHEDNYRPIADEERS